MYNDEIVNPNDDLLKIIEKNMRYFTRLVYIPQLLKFTSPLDYQNANFIIIPQKFQVDPAFLKGKLVTWTS
jgi:hypothetical protein